MVASGRVGEQKSPVCQGKCENYPDCNAFCIRIGYKSGQCVPPFGQFCCCDP